jgi:hypothetical protein
MPNTCINKRGVNNMPYCIVLDQISGEVKIFPYKEGEQGNITEFLENKAMDLENIQYMCVDEVIVRTEE